jgi:hypothetical protein
MGFIFREERMTTFAVQFLESSPATTDTPVRAVRAKLRDAFERLPISQVLVGWNLPDALLDACAEECARAGAHLYRWHPLLTGDGTLVPEPAWQTIGLSGQPIPGFREMPEFTFVCPNRPAVREAVLAHLRDVLRDERYQGVFLDRIRFPSPAENPGEALGCFCEDCRRAAEAQGLDLAMVHRDVIRLVATAEGAKEYVRALLDAPQGEAEQSLLQAFLNFRSRSVARFVWEAAGMATEMGKAIGLDAFSPALTRMVGQSLGALDAACDWVKIMSYGHVLGPAGIPFELLGLAGWLVERHCVEESEAMALLAEAARLPLPPDRAALRANGLPPDALRMEAGRGRAMGVRALLAGIELVEMPGIVALSDDQIGADLAAFREAGADGLVLSWDLWLMPPERLDIVREVWRSRGAA